MSPTKRPRERQPLRAGAWRSEARPEKATHSDESFVDKADADSDMRALFERQAPRGEIVQDRNALGAELLFG